MTFMGLLFAAAFGGYGIASGEPVCFLLAALFFALGLVGPGKVR